MVLDVIPVIYSVLQIRRKWRWVGIGLEIELICHFKSEIIMKMAIEQVISSLIITVRTKRASFYSKFCVFSRKFEVLGPKNHKFANSIFFYKNSVNFTLVALNPKTTDFAFIVKWLNTEIYEISLNFDHVTTKFW